MVPMEPKGQQVPLAKRVRLDSRGPQALRVRRDPLALLVYRDNPDSLDRPVRRDPKARRAQPDHRGRLGRRIRGWVAAGCCRLETPNHLSGKLLFPWPHDAWVKHRCFNEMRK